MSDELNDTGLENEGFVETQEVQDDDASDGDPRAAAKAAVRAALAERGEEEGDVPETPREAKPAKAAAPATDEDKELREALARRRESSKAKLAQRDAYSKEQEKTRTLYHELEKEKANFARQKASFELLKKDPIRAIRENGWDPAEFIEDIATDGTPEGNAKREKRDLLEQIAELRAWQKSQEGEREAQVKAREESDRKNFRVHVEREFIRTAFGENPEAPAHPHLEAFYRGDEDSLIAQADIIADKYKAATGGKQASFIDIALYLEERCAAWYKRMEGKKNPQVVKGKPGPGGISGGKSLSSADSSERRTLGKVAGNVDAETRIQEAKDAVRAALRARGDE